MRTRFGRLLQHLRDNEGAASSPCGISRSAARCYIALTVCCAAYLCAVAAPARADTVVLENGGRITGTVMEGEIDNRLSIRTPEGAVVTLDREHIKAVERLRPIEREYLQRREQIPDTVEAHLELAEWCTSNFLGEQRDAELRRVLELDPDQQRARSLLGYIKTEQGWQTRDEIMQQRGYVRYKGRWMLPQEVQILEEKAAAESQQQEWIRKLAVWTEWLGTDRTAAAEKEIREIRDPAAVGAILKMIEREKRDTVRLLLIDTLGQIESPQAKRALAILAMNDPLEEARLTCLDHLVEQPTPDIVPYFVNFLKSNDNKMIHRAARALQRLGDPSAIPALIDALVTTHKIKLTEGRSGAMTAAFGTGPDGNVMPGLSMGDNKPKYVRQRVANRPVLEALVTLSGANFGFEQKAWRTWYAKQKNIEAREAIQRARPQDESPGDG